MAIHRAGNHTDVELMVEMLAAKRKFDSRRKYLMSGIKFARRSLSPNMLTICPHGLRPTPCNHRAAPKLRNINELLP